MHDFLWIVELVHRLFHSVYECLPVRFQCGKFRKIHANIKNQIFENVVHDFPWIDELATCFLQYHEGLPVPFTTHGRKIYPKKRAIIRDFFEWTLLYYWIRWFLLSVSQGPPCIHAWIAWWSYNIGYAITTFSILIQKKFKKIQWYYSSTTKAPPYIWIYNTYSSNSLPWPFPVLPLTLPPPLSQAENEISENLWKSSETRRSWSYWFWYHRGPPWCTWIHNAARLACHEPFLSSRSLSPHSAFRRRIRFLRKLRDLQK